MNSMSKMQSKAYTYALCGLFAALTAVGAFIRVPVPLVPFTLQFLFTALSGVLLGSKRGMISQLVYVGIGLAGIPVFTQGGGIGYIFQPTFGYLIGFIGSAYVAGKIVEVKGYSFKVILGAALAGLMVAYIVGVIYLYMIKNLYLGSEMSLWSALMIGAISCFPGDFIICLITALVGSNVVPILRKTQLI